MTDVIPAPRARELTAEEHELWVQNAFADQQTIKAGLQEARGGLWKAAEALYRFAETSGWLALGYETIGEWLADPDITLTRPTYFRMTQAWKELAVTRDVPVSTLRQLDLTKTQIALPALKAGRATVDEVIDDVEQLGARDLREKYADPDKVRYGDTYWDPTGDGVDGLPDDAPDSSEPPILIEPSPDEDQAIVLHAAQILMGVLLRVRRELGSDERKAMSKGLREQIDDAIEYAYNAGIGEQDARE